ncbi:hypothetical protein M3Y94_00123400 [Aphelenchoides besseyi]|nr:hypothetical protein M3Y94_00123400 [Aphelenchoides besseyi]
MEKKKLPQRTYERAVTLDDEPRLQPEVEVGNVEYKSRLLKISASRLEHLTTQLKWRLHEGSGQCYYLLGVEDDGTMSGLNRDDMNETLSCVKQMAENAGATMIVVDERTVRGNRSVVQVSVRALPTEQPNNNLRIGILGNASVGKSTIAGCLTHGVLDDGAGSGRLNMLRHRHEIYSGKTTTISQDVFGFTSNGEVVNYKDYDLATILERSSKLIHLFDLAGDQKYLKTTVYGISGHKPNYCALLINAKAGWGTMTQEHWEIARAFKVPIFFIITKIDLVSEKRVSQIVHQIRGKCAMDVRFIETPNEAERCAETMSSAKTLPIFAVSSVSGANFDLLLKFFNSLPLPTLRSINSCAESRPLLYIDQVFRIPETGTVVCGHVANGSFLEGDSVQVGPDFAGHFGLAKIVSIQRNKQPVPSIRANEVGSLAIQFSSEFDSNAVRKGMVILNAQDVGVCCRRFVAKFRLLSHTSDELCIGFQGTAYIGSLRRTVTVVDFEPECIRLGEKDCDVTFEFYGGPEFVSVGSTLFFRESNTKGLGEVISIPAA